ncbi:VWA domain-containing protein (plasmid) [Azospirillum argentinense]|uniref:VWA domain-containing protein n=1 Tax=Azospirillum argentinense TaxID=2970906 RepID=A0A4D8PQ77_9PROT|nr:VWA domain-containing protein [Azospirillum argentinense]QCN97089.1 VWA domain-containing protein [Azospirillum argentinense]
MDGVDGLIALADVESRLRAYGAALWGSDPPLRPLVGEGDPAALRPRFEADLVRLPVVWPSLDLYQAALAHVGAHRMFSRPWPAKGLKPLLTIVVSLVEDARVEHLAMRRLPGLRRLWAPFHRVEPSPSLMAADLLERLARALFDAGYKDGNAWVDKGQRLFFEQPDRWDDPNFSLALGGDLAGDLGKTRVQVNVRGHRVDPAYRDDNGGLWLYDTPPEPPRDADDPLEAVRPESAEGEGTRRNGPPQASPSPVPLAVADTAPLRPVARYPEWDNRIGLHRPDFVQVVECVPEQRQPLDAPADPRLAGRVRALVRHAVVARPERLRRQREGDGLDFDACIAASVARRQGHAPDMRVHRRVLRRGRDLSVLLLLDASHSTNDPAGDGTVLDLERRSADLLAGALAAAGDRFALAAFRSDGREAVHWLPVKRFAESYDGAARGRLAGLDGRWSTRMGAAIRHAGATLAAQPTLRRLLLLVTDGEPSDIDCPDPRHLVEDARKAVRELAGRGIDVVCVALGGDPQTHHRIFGRRNVLPVDRVERLPEILPAVYVRLTG